jgi:hypothetical protein
LVEVKEDPQNPFIPSKINYSKLLAKGLLDITLIQITSEVLTFTTYAYTLLLVRRSTTASDAS